MNNFERIRLTGAIIYTSITTIFFGAVCIALFFFEIPQGMMTIASILFGALVVCYKDSGSFWTGSTAGSQGKDAALAETAKEASATIASVATGTMKAP